MNTQAELNAKIELLKRTFEVEQSILVKLGNIKHNVLSIDSKSPFISIKIDNLSDLKICLDKLPPVDKTHEIGSERDNYHTILNSPFKLTLENPAVVNSSQNCYLDIKYKTTNFDIWIQLPQSFVNDFCVRSERAPSDSEQVYFMGVAQSKYKDLRVMCYKWQGFNNCISWYGGNQTLTDSDKTNEIMNLLTK